jgi:hypothetical protein
MKSISTGALAALLIAVSAPAFAQGTPAQEQGARGGAVTGVIGGAAVGAVVGGPIGAVIGGVIGASAGATVGAITAEDRVYIQQYVYSRPVDPVVVQTGVTVGQPLPAGVAVYSFQDNPRLANYRYAYVNQQYILVDGNGRVMGSIER